MSQCLTTDVQTVNLPIDQGASFQVTLSFFEADNITPLDVSTWTFESSIRQVYDNPIILANFTFTHLSSNQILMSLTPIQTDALPISPSTLPGVKNLNKLSYDVKATLLSGIIYMIQQGSVYVNPAVTQT